MNHFCALDVNETYPWSDLLRDYDTDVLGWKPKFVQRFGDEFARFILEVTRSRFKSLLPQIPYIGSDEYWSGSFLESVRCLALFQEMNISGETPYETSQILYEAILARQGEHANKLTADQVLTKEQLMERRKQRAALTQERRYPEGYVAEFVPGNGEEFDYGYNFTECAAQKFYIKMHAEVYLPFFCRLDFAYSQIYGLGLKRTVTLAEGGSHCDHRFKSPNR